MHSNQSVKLSMIGCVLPGLRQAEPARQYKVNKCGGKWAYQCKTGLLPYRLPTIQDLVVVTVLHRCYKICISCVLIPYYSIVVRKLSLCGIIILLDFY